MNRNLIAQKKGPDSELILWEVVEGQGKKYEIVMNGVFIMASYNRLSSERLLELPMEKMNKRENLRILVGGLGMGFTVQAACSFPSIVRIDVVAEPADQLLVIFDQNLGVLHAGDESPQAEVVDRRPVHGDVGMVLQDPIVVVVGHGHGPQVFVGLGDEEQVERVVGVLRVALDVLGQKNDLLARRFGPLQDVRDRADQDEATRPLLFMEAPEELTQHAPLLAAADDVVVAAALACSEQQNNGDRCRDQPKESGPWKSAGQR